MSEQQFARLAPFIREYIFQHRWTELRDIQIQAIQAILDTDAHLLLTSGTASGKTEAAFLPILTLLSATPASSLGVLYIGPTKALINDQFYRLQGLLAEAHIPVWSWHGDVGASQKERLLCHPQGVLQITPESLESLLVNQTQHLEAMFHDLRFVIIDEVHVFMGSDRGQQIMCQLGRLARHTRTEPRRIGLSATLGDTEGARRWLASGSRREVLAPHVAVSGQRLRLSLEHFCRPAEDTEVAVQDPYYRYIFEQSQGRKCLIFANRRSETEAVVTALRQIAAEQGLPDIYHVHHGSVAPALRLAAEAAMRAPQRPAVTAATVTLELGIDLGQLETIIQLEAPHSVMSWLQRLGRSGRRGGAQEMRLVTSELEFVGGGEVPLPWQLLQSMAIIELYLQERWIEPVEPPRYPYSLLYQQTMSTLLAAGELQPAQLAQQVLTLAPFQHITKADYRRLLQHLLAIDHLEQLETGALIIGLAGEKVVSNWRFYAVFPDSEEYGVHDGTREIGSINYEPTVGELIALAGSTWEVREVVGARRQVLVRAAPGLATAHWSGISAPVHQRVLGKMRHLLLHDTGEYRYLRPGARSRLDAARAWAKSVGLAERSVLPWGEQQFCIFPWCGSRSFSALERALRQRGRGLGVRNVIAFSPYYLLVQTEQGKADQLEQSLRQLRKEIDSGETFLEGCRIPRLNKYDVFLPPELLRQAYSDNQRPERMKA